MEQEKKTFTFSKRIGIELVNIPFQVDHMDSELRIELWNAYYIFIQIPYEHSTGNENNKYRSLIASNWAYFFKKPLDDFPEYACQHNDFIKDFFNTGDWYKIYEFLEYLFKKIDKISLFQYKKFEKHINEKLRSNNSGYTLSNNMFIPITNQLEIDEVSRTKELSEHYELSGIQKHLYSAIELLSQKPNPDYRNSIKESISMVEVISRIIEPTENTLGKALSKLDRKNKINKTLKLGFEKLYAYTNDKNGIRHALMDDQIVEIEDAKLFLISCSAFTNYLIEKACKDDLFERKSNS